MTPYKTLAKALARYIGDDAVLSFQDGPKLRGQFIVVQVANKRPIGQAEIRYRNEPTGPDVIEQVAAARDLMYSIDVVRNSDTHTAADRAEELQLRLHSSAARQEMLGYGLALTRISDTRDLTGGVDAAAEPRFGFDVFYNTVQTIEETILSIESVTITGHFQSISTPPKTED